MPNDAIKQVLASIPDWNTDWHHQEARQHLDGDTLTSVFVSLVPVTSIAWKVELPEPLLLSGPQPDTHTDDLYTDTYFIAILEHPDLKALDAILKLHFVKMNIKSNPALLKRVLIHPNPVSLCSAMLKLQNQPEFTSYSLEDVLKHADPDQYIEAVYASFHHHVNHHALLNRVLKLHPNPLSYQRAFGLLQYFQHTYLQLDDTMTTLSDHAKYPTPHLCACAYACVTAHVTQHSPRSRFAIVSQLEVFRLTLKIITQLEAFSHQYPDTAPWYEPDNLIKMIQAHAQHGTLSSLDAVFEKLVQQPQFMNARFVQRLLKYKHVAAPATHQQDLETYLYQPGTRRSALPPRPPRPGSN